MKKRIIAILLVLSIFLLSFPRIEQRAYAEPVSIAVVAGTALIAALSILVCAAAAPGTSIEAYGGEFSGGGGAAESIFNKSETYTILSEGVVDSSGDIVYRNNTAMLMQLGILAQSIQDGISQGFITEYDDSVTLSDIYLQLALDSANSMIKSMARPNINFTAGYDCTFLDVDLSKQFTLKSLPTMSQFLPTGESYAAVYFDDNRIVFSSYYLIFSHPGLLTDSTGGGFGYRYLLSNFIPYSSSWGSSTNFGTLSELYDFFSNVAFAMPSLSKFFYTVDSKPAVDQSPFNYCFVYENGNVTYTPVSDVDVSGMNSGLITTTGDYGDFLKSIDGYSITSEGLPAIDFPVDIPSDSTISIPLDPDITKPIDDQISVAVPGVGDLTIADLRADLDIDIEVPSIIVDKFPFCIPFDFVRFLGILCADPVAPVFRIPISTHPDNLEQWKGNQTIGDYIDPDSPPLFDIDEEIVIDLSVIPLVQPICYTCFIVGFIFLLLHITPKMIQH